MSRVLVTGVAGMIMSHVCDRLIENGHDVFGVDDLSGGVRENVPRGVKFFKDDIGDAFAMRHAFSVAQPDFVIHGAAFAAENLSHNTRVFTIENNLAGEAVIRNLSIEFEVKCMVSLSSIAVMGHQEPPFHDDTPPMPEDPYGICKFAGELDARAAYKFHGLNYCVWRPHNVAGTRQNGSDKYRNVAAIFIRQALEKKPLTIFGDGSQTRAFSPVGYVSKIIAQTVDRSEVWNGAYNLGSDRVITILNLAKIVCELTGVQENFQFLDQRKDAKHAHMTHLCCQKFFPEVSDSEEIRTVLSSMIAEARAKGYRPMQRGPRIEVQKGLPPSWS
jgi:UDP-glucose 4-epimerase